MPQIPVTTRIATDRPLVKVDNMAVPQPPAGAGFSIVVPVGYRFSIVALFFRLITDANVGARTLIFDVTTFTSPPFTLSVRQKPVTSYSPQVSLISSNPRPFLTQPPRLHQI
jgi:hypothetical protein